jgi:hypothetical protein
MMSPTRTPQAPLLRLLLAAALALTPAACADDADNGAADVSEQDTADATEAGDIQGIDLPDGVSSALPNCPGYKDNPNMPVQHHEFCEAFITDDMLASGDTCFIVTDPGTPGCFCQVCALRGGQERCVFEVCK